jgi:hypothetical protein
MSQAIYVQGPSGCRYKVEQVESWDEMEIWCGDIFMYTRKHNYMYWTEVHNLTTGDEWDTNDSVSTTIAALKEHG